MTTPTLVATTHAMVVDLAFKTHFYLLLECCSQNSKSAGSFSVHLAVQWVSNWLIEAIIMWPSKWEGRGQHGSPPPICLELNLI